MNNTKLFNRKTKHIIPAPWRSRAAHSGLMCKCLPLLQISDTGLQFTNRLIRGGLAWADAYVGSINRCILTIELCQIIVLSSPRVSGLIHEVAQCIFNGQPLKTLEKHAPIWTRKYNNKSFKCSYKVYIWFKIYIQNIHAGNIVP